MSLTNPFTITYGDFGLGGSSETYLLSAPYVIDLNPSDLRMVFEVTVVAGSHAALKNSSEDLEDAMSRRDVGLVIDIGGTTFDYVFGTDILNTSAALQKSGDATKDRGYSRSYTCTIEGKRPAVDLEGLRELEVSTAFEAGRQMIVTMRGVYTQLNGTNAVATYRSNFDSEASTLLTAIDSEAVWELAHEEVAQDRLVHHATFTRQYVQLLFDQTGSDRDDDEITDHRVIFTDLHAHPGDSQQDIQRLRRVEAAYDCAIDIEQTEDLQQVWDQKIRPHVIDSFKDLFEPHVYAIENTRVGYDETRKRLSAALQFVYQKAGGSEIVEVSESCAYREQRNIDYTPVHGSDELAYEADAGWAIRERVWSRTAVALGNDFPKTRIAGQPAAQGPAGGFEQSFGGGGSAVNISGVDTRNDGTVKADGWNVTQSTSQVTKQWIGDSDSPEGQVQVSVLSETVVERFHRLPVGGGGTTTPGGI